MPTIAPSRSTLPNVTIEDDQVAKITIIDRPMIVFFLQDRTGKPVYCFRLVDVLTGLDSSLIQRFLQTWRRPTSIGFELVPEYVRLNSFGGSAVTPVGVLTAMGIWAKEAQRGNHW